MNKISRTISISAFFILLSFVIISCSLSEFASLPERSTQSVVDLSQTLAAHEATINKAKAEAQTAATTQAYLATEKASLSAAHAALQQTATQEISNAMQAASENSTQVASENSTQVADLRNLSATQYMQIEDYNNSIRCVDRPTTVNFSSNASVSASLKSWLENTSEKINNAEWEVVWDGTETAIHRFEGENYYYVFMVYFDEPDNYYYASIYDVYMHCFIYP